MTLADVMAPYLRAEQLIRGAGFTPDYAGTPPNDVVLLWKRGTTRMRLFEAAALVEIEGAR